MGSLAQASGRRYLGLDNPEDKDKVQEVINNILAGKLNNNGIITLTINSATTTFTDSRIGSNSVIHLMPTTINAAGEIPNIYFTAFAKGSCTINHPNNAKNDRTYFFTITG